MKRCIFFLAVFGVAAAGWFYFSFFCGSVTVINPAQHEETLTFECPNGKTLTVTVPAYAITAFKLPFDPGRGALTMATPQRGKTELAYVESMFAGDYCLILSDTPRMTFFLIDEQRKRAAWWSR